MNEVITGADGQLGRALSQQYPEAFLANFNKLDISNPQQVKNFNWSNTQKVVNAAAYTQVDNAETPDGIISAWQANSQGVANLAAVATEHELCLVHVSTDYVFDGQQSHPYREDDIPNPQNIYGRSKLAGDLACSSTPKHYIVRTSWVIGDGNNFVRTMLKLGTDHKELTVVNDQIGRPTFATDLAKAIHHLDQNQTEFGLYNFSNDGEPASWADFAKAIFEIAKLDCKVRGITTAEYSTGKKPWASRPANSLLDLEKIKETGLKITDWREALKTYIEQETNK